MKLIDILVEELPKRGGWPAGYKSISQDGTHSYHKGNIYAYINPLNRTRYWVEDHNAGYGLLLFNGYEVAEDASTSLVNRQQYEAALASKNDGWIEWGGGECPVPRGTLVDVKYLCGDINRHIKAGEPDSSGSIDTAFAVRWSKLGAEYDIIAYRLHKTQEAEQVEADEADEEADLNECIGQDAAPAWNGEGLPPVGCECEYSLNGGKTWWKCKIDYIVGTQGVIMLCDTFEGVQYVQFSSYGNALKFRPIRSEAERKRDEAGLAIYHAINWNSEGELVPASRMEDYKKAYDAIAAGKIPGVKLED